MSSETAIVPDTKDWTWVLSKPCAECGFVASAVTTEQIPAVIRDNATTWAAVLGLADAATRPAPNTWSPLEYACHVRDVHRIFDLRVGMMLDQDDPQFPNWDQDETAIEDKYGEQDSATVSADLLEAAEAVARRYESVPDDAWDRKGYRSNGSEFTIESIGIYHLHDIVHHAWDVRAAVARATVAAYDASAAAYRDGTEAGVEIVLAAVADFAAAVGAGGRVLEIGSAGGRDAKAMEESGLSVRRTDISPGFVELMRSEGFAADVVDPLTDDLDGPYDGVWANACLLHVDRADLPVVLSRLAEATRPDGLLRFSVKEGDGETWSTHGHVTGSRHFTFWREEPLRAVVEDAGWAVERVTQTDGMRGERWLEMWSRRR